MIKFFIACAIVLVPLLAVFILYRAFLAGGASRGAEAIIIVGGRSYEAEVARTFSQKAKGLAGRESLAPGSGMVFLLGQKSWPAFTMHGMHFSLDIIWIADGRIIDISADLPPDTGLLPSSYRPRAPADTVLELPAGTAAADGLKIGDSVILKER